MLALSRALADQPLALLVDEISLGLAPMVVRRLLDAIRDAANEGMAILLVEQSPELALHYADRGYVLQLGRIVLEGTSTELLRRFSEIEASYLSRGPSASGTSETSEPLDRNSNYGD